jgi:class 3 adenylate cyclase
VEKVIQPALEAQYATTFKIQHRVGIDSSRLFIARTGTRGSNDLVWVGNAANRAAKLSALKRSWNYRTYITHEVYSALLDPSKFGGEKSENMWTDLGTTDMGYRIYGSNWHWAI